jgi:hypothetical protein
MASTFQMSPSRLGLLGPFERHTSTLKCNGKRAPPRFKTFYIDNRQVSPCPEFPFVCYEKRKTKKSLWKSYRYVNTVYKVNSNPHGYYMDTLI